MSLNNQTNKVGQSSKGLFFDWYGVLQTFSYEKFKNNFYDIAHSKYLEKGVKFEYNVLGTNEFKKQIKEDYEKYKIGKISTYKFWNNIMYKLNINKIDSNKMVNVSDIKKSIVQGAGDINYELLEYIKQKNKEGINIAILSNGSKELYYNQKKIILNENIEDILFYSSWDLKLQKPKNEFFNKALNKFNLYSKDVIYVDDQDKNINKTNLMGFKTEQYDMKLNNLNNLIKIMDNHIESSY